MIDNAAFYDAALGAGLDFFTGVPDSLLKHFCAYVAERTPRPAHWIAANEGNAVALAAGHYLATGNPALVYLQNSGLGNAVNPLVSLADPDVYAIPMLLLIGWRGEPGVPDEPQHVKQGAITPGLCEAAGIPHRILPTDTQPAIECLQEMVRTALANHRPVALIVRAGSFAAHPAAAPAPPPEALNREDVIAAIVAALPPRAVVVATTGHISRELFEIRSRGSQGHERDFLTVGSMGHASQIAMGIALARPDRPVICLDGDGAALMHMGSLAIAGTSGAGNLLHVVLNNGVHGSVGGQPTVGFSVDFPGMALACGYRSAVRVESRGRLTEALANLRPDGGPHFMEVRVAPGARKDLGRPTTSPLANKTEFMNHLGGHESVGS